MIAPTVPEHVNAVVALAPQIVQTVFPPVAVPAVVAKYPDAQADA